MGWVILENPMTNPIEMDETDGGVLEEWGYPKSPCEKSLSGLMTWMIRGYHHFRQPSDFIESRQMGMGQN